MNPREDRRFTAKEISEASGISTGIIYYRIQRLGIMLTRDGITYEEAKRVIRYKWRQCRSPSRQKIEILKKMLETDGM
jgi:hypothetical protein